MSKTLFDKVWERHIVVPETDANPATLYIDLHLIHEVTSPQAFTELNNRGLKVRRPDRTLATIDHSTPTCVNPDGSRPYVTPLSESSKSFEDAIENAVERTGKTVKNIRSAYVNEMSTSIKGTKIDKYRVNVKITFEVGA